MPGLSHVGWAPAQPEGRDSIAAEAYCSQGDALLRQRRFREALDKYNEAIALNPDEALALNNRGTTLKELGRFEEALDSYNCAIALLPDRAELYNNRGNVLQGLDRLEDAVDSYDAAIRLNPEYAEAYNNRGVVLRQMKQLAEAIASLDRALLLKPDYPEAIMNRSLVDLTMGEFATGWRRCEARHRTKQPLTQRNFARPRWSGDADISGKTILIHGEGGYGDVILLSRYLAPLQAVGARVLFAPQQPLRGLMRGLHARVQLVDLESDFLLFDYHCPIMSLPFVFKTEPATIPREIYLAADEEKIATWEHYLGEKTKPRVGVVWRRTGRPDSGRSISLDQFQQLFDTHFDFISLQKHVTEAECARLDRLDICHPGEALFDFSDTAALCRLMDLVISVDTSVVHLGAALGMPVWVLVPWCSNWIWMLDREDSPWYPSARLFRQQTRGDWAAVLERVHRELLSLCDGGAP
jgi:Tfp pilus assembly protein PilF